MLPLKPAWMVGAVMCTPSPIRARELLWSDREQFSHGDADPAAGVERVPGQFDQRGLAFHAYDLHFQRVVLQARLVDKQPVRLSFRLKLHESLIGEDARTDLAHVNPPFQSRISCSVRDCRGYYSRRKRGCQTSSGGFDKTRCGGSLALREMGQHL